MTSREEMTAKAEAEWASCASKVDFSGYTPASRELAHLVFVAAFCLGAEREAEFTMTVIERYQSLVADKDQLLALKQETIDALKQKIEILQAGDNAARYARIGPYNHPG